MKWEAGISRWNWTTVTVSLCLQLILRLVILLWNENILLLLLLAFKVCFGYIRFHSIHACQTQSIFCGRCSLHWSKLHWAAIMHIFISTQYGRFYKRCSTGWTKANISCRKFAISIFPLRKHPIWYFLTNFKLCSLRINFKGKLGPGQKALFCEAMLSTWTDMACWRTFKARNRARAKP